MSAPGSIQIFKATYSGVPVYEYIANGIACMRRRSDAWLNATQILKVADFDKPARTRILEREVQRGKHEKVQGGYGKYQGTWIPLERARELAELYKVDKILQPILDFRPSTESPPLAPKHITAASTKPRPRVARPPPVKKVKKLAAVPRSPIPKMIHEEEYEEDGDLSDMDLHRRVLGDQESSSNGHDEIDENMTDIDNDAAIRSLRQSRGQMDENDFMDVDSINEDFGGHEFSGPHAVRRQTYSDVLLDYFVSAENDVPEFLKSPPDDFRVDEIIDNEGHTAFHWAVAMGDLRVMNLLLQAGADWRAVNVRGETALMRAVLFTNCFDRKCFPKVVEILRDSLYECDKFQATVFHHISATTNSKNKLLASRYYAEVLLQKLTEQEVEMSEIGSILDLKDIYGNTALTIAARNGAKKCIRTFLAYHANPHIRNNEGLTADYFIAAAQQNPPAGNPTTIPSSSPFAPTPHHRRQPPTQPPPHFPSFSALPHKSEAAIRATQKAIPLLAQKLETLATSFDAELSEKEKDLEQARSLLDNVERERQIAAEAAEEIARELPGGEEGFAAVIEQLEREVQEKEDELNQIVERRNWEGLGALRTDGAPVEGDSAQLAQMIREMEEERKELVRTSVELRKKSAGRARVEEYRRLISACCGLPVESIDEMLPELLKAMEGDGLEGTLGIGFGLGGRTAEAAV